MITVEDAILIRQLTKDVEYEYFNGRYDSIPWAADGPNAVEKEVVRRFNKKKNGVE